MNPPYAGAPPPGNGLIQDGLEFLLVVVAHPVGVPGDPAGDLADARRPGRGRGVVGQTAEAAAVVADYGVGAGEALLTEFGVSFTALVWPSFQRRWR